MIQVITGTIGGGKTLSCVYWGMQYVANGGKWITNININPKGCKEYLKKTYKWELQDGQIVPLPNDLSDLQNHLVRGSSKYHVLCTVDEASEWFDSYANGKEMIGVMSFFRQSRKFHIDLDLITQDLSFIQKRVRVMASTIWRMIDLGAYRLPGLGIKMIPPWSWQIRLNQFDRTGKNFIRKKYIEKNKLLFACYTTTETYRSFGDSLDMSVGKVNFTGGKIKDKDMSKFWKFVAVTPWIFCIILTVIILNDVDDYEEPIKDIQIEENQTNIIADDVRLFAPMSFISSKNYDVVAVWQSEKFWDHKITPYGIVLTITPSCIILRREDGGLTMLLDGKLPEEKFAKKGVDNKSSI